MTKIKNDKIVFYEEHGNVSVRDATETEKEFIKKFIKQFPKKKDAIFINPKPEPIPKVLQECLPDANSTEIDTFVAYGVKNHKNGFDRGYTLGVIIGIISICVMVFAINDSNSSAISKYAVVLMIGFIVIQIMTGRVSVGLDIQANWKKGLKMGMMNRLLSKIMRYLYPEKIESVWDNFIFEQITIANPNDVSKEKTLKMMVDSGSSVLILPHSLLKELSINLNPSYSFLQSSAGMQFADSAIVRLKVRGEVKLLRALFIKGNEDAIIGLNELCAFSYDIDTKNKTIRKWEDKAKLNDTN